MKRKQRLLFNQKKILSYLNQLDQIQNDVSLIMQVYGLQLKWKGTFFFLN